MKLLTLIKYRRLRKLMNKNENWDDLLQSVVFSINTNKSATTGFSPFYLMHGRQARLPFEVETLDKNTTPQAEQIEGFADECKPYEQAVFNHTEEMVKIQQEIFPQTMCNIKKLQYLKRKGVSEIQIKDGDLVLRRNMLQKTKKGYKMQDHWLGPYMAVKINKEKGVCYLKHLQNGKQLKRQIPLKQVEIYRECSNATAKDPPVTASANKLLPAEDPPVTASANEPLPAKDPFVTTSANQPSCTATSKLTTGPFPNAESDTYPKEHYEHNSILGKLLLEDINRALDCLQPELKNILTGEQASWYHELQTTGKSASQPDLMKRDIPSNVYLAAFSLNGLLKEFPTTSLELTRV